MKNQSTRRGQTQIVVHKNCHSRAFLSGISLIRIWKEKGQLLLNKQPGQKGDPRLQLSGMTPRFITARGFTLIELLVVVLIIGILAAVALPQYNKAVKKSRGTEVLVALDALDKGLTNYYLENGTYTGATPDVLNITIPDVHHFKYLVGTASSYEQGNFQPYVDAGGPNSHVYLVSPENIWVIGSWEKGKLQIIYCSPTTSGLFWQQKSCADYFNCNATPLVYHPGTQTGSPIIPAFYTGGGCRLK